MLCEVVQKFPHFVRVEVVEWITRYLCGVVIPELCHLHSFHNYGSCANNARGQVRSPISNLLHETKNDPLVVTVTVPGVTSQIDDLKILPVRVIGNKFLEGMFIFGLSLSKNVFVLPLEDI